MQSSGPLSAAEGGDLDRRIGAVIEIGLHPGQRRDQPLVADREAHPPAGHGIGLRHRGELDQCSSIAPSTSQHRGRRIVVEVEFGIGEVGEDEDVVLAREVDEVLVEVERGDERRRIRRVAHHHRDRLRNGVHHRALQQAGRSWPSGRPGSSAPRRRPSGSRRRGSGRTGPAPCTTSPGAVIACATLAKPSLEPSVATTCVSGLRVTPKRRLIIGRLRPPQPDGSRFEVE